MLDRKQASFTMSGDARRLSREPAFTNKSINETSSLSRAAIRKRSY